MRALVFILAVAVSACTARAPEMVETADPLPADPSVIERVGTVRVVGSAPVNVQVTLQQESGGQLPIRGPLAREIERLSGVEVAIEGRLGEGGLEATGYKVRSVDGAAAIMGTVERAAGGGLQLRTDSGEVIRLSGAEPHLRAGQKVWVQGPSTLQVQSYGVITP